MHKIYNKKLKQFKLTPRLTLLRDSTLSIIYITANFALALICKSIWLPKCEVTSSRCEDLILLHFYLQMLMIQMLKTHETV